MKAAIASGHTRRLPPLTPENAMKNLIAVACLALSSVAVANSRPISPSQQPSAAAVKQFVAKTQDLSSTKGMTVKFNSNVPTPDGPKEGVADVFKGGKQIATVNYNRDRIDGYTAGASQGL
jgi:outer membrane lipoprotein-sorting protein